jgi:hypothetical protein
VSNLELDGGVGIVIKASNVTVSNVAVLGSSGESAYPVKVGDATDVANNVTLDHLTVLGQSGPTGPVNAGILVDWQSANATVSSSNIGFATTGVQYESGTGVMHDNYIHDIDINNPGSHLNGVASSSGGTGLDIEHNTVIGPDGQTDSVALFCDSGTQKNATINNNLLDGGNYTIYGGGSGATCTASNNQTTNIRITNNRIGQSFFPSGGYYGWLANFASSNPGNVLAGNVWDATGLPAPG